MKVEFIPILTLSPVDVPLISFGSQLEKKILVMTNTYDYKVMTFGEWNKYTSDQHNLTHWAPIGNIFVNNDEVQLGKILDDLKIAEPLKAQIMTKYGQ